MKLNFLYLIVFSFLVGKYNIFQFEQHSCMLSTKTAPITFLECAQRKKIGKYKPSNYFNYSLSLAMTNNSLSCKSLTQRILHTSRNWVLSCMSNQVANIKMS